jgi:signal transduction histidine kinase
MYRFEWVPGFGLITAVLIFPLAPAFAMIALLVAALAVLVVLAALAVAVLASPCLLLRSVRRRAAARHLRETEVAQRRVARPAVAP